MSGGESTGTQPTMEEKTVGYGGEERGREQVPSFFFSFFLFLLDG